MKSLVEPTQPGAIGSASQDKYPIHLEGTELSRAQSGTIRNKLLKIGTRVTVSVRRIVFHYSTGYPYQNLFRRIIDRLAESSSLGFG